MSSMYIFTPKRGSLICHVLLIVQNTQRRALLFIDNRQFIGFSRKQNYAASTDTNVLSFTGPWRNVKRWLQFRRNSNLQLFVFLLLGREDSVEILASVWQEEEPLKFWNAAISKYIQPAFSCVIEKLLIFYIYEI